MNEPQDQTAPQPRTRAIAFAAILRDRRVSLGAFKLWHCLESFVNLRRPDSVVWPSFRTLRKEFGFRFESIPAWLDELERTGWLRIMRDFKTAPGTRGGKRGHSKYELLDGQGLAIPKPVSHSATETGIAPKRYRKRYRRDTETGSGAIPKPVAEFKGVHKGLPKNKKFTPAATPCGSALGAQPQVAAGNWRGTF